MDRFISVTDAKAQLSSLIADVMQGSEVVITRHGRPMVRLILERRPPLRPGLFREIFPEESLSETDFDAEKSEMEKQWALWRDKFANSDLESS